MKYYVICMWIHMALSKTTSHLVRAGAWLDFVIARWCDTSPAKAVYKSLSLSDTSFVAGKNISDVSGCFKEIPKTLHQINSYQTIIYWTHTAKTWDFHGFSSQEPPTRQDIQTVGWGAAYPFPLDLPILKSTQKSSAPTQKALAEQDNMFRLGLAAQLCYLQHWYFDSPLAHFPRTGSPQKSMLFWNFDGVVPEISWLHEHCLYFAVVPAFHLDMMGFDH